MAAPKKVTYFLLSPANEVKIGVSTNLLRRKQVLESAVKQKLTLLGYMPGNFELYFFTEFASERIAGEWFRASDRLLAEIRKRCEDTPVRANVGRGRAYRRTKRGAPRHGNVRFSTARIADLPETPDCTDYARVLGVHYATVRRWIDGGAPFDSRAAFVAWLQETGRYRPRREY